MGVLGISEQVALDEETVDLIVSVAHEIFAGQLDWHSAVELWEQLEDARKLMSLNESIKAWHSLLRNL
jgi:fumarate hydratase class II